MNSEALPAAEYRDRSTALLVAGIAEIVLGVGAWLMVGLMMVGTHLARQNGIPTASMVPSLILYGGAGSVFILLGIGSIRRRRWARNLWLVVSAGWTVAGVLGLLGMIVVLPVVLRVVPEGNPSVAGVMRVVMVVTMAFVAFLMLLVPVVIFLFYRSGAVRATIESAEPTESWTDRYPLRLLGAVLFLSTMAVMMASTPLVGGGVFPLFGRFVDGSLGTGLWWLMALGSASAAVGLMARRLWAWTVAMLLVLVLGATSMITYARADMRVMYEAMGMVSEQMEQLERLGLMRPGVTMVPSGIGFGLALVFLLWVRLRLRPPGGKLGDGKEKGNGSGLAVPPPSL